MAKIYSKQKAIGNAGAFKFGELITRMFSWPVRLIDESTDLGVDAEIEVCDDDGKSTHKLLKAQIKSTYCNPDLGNHTIYLKQNDINYLAKSVSPVIIVSVDISAHSGVYWKPLDLRQINSKTPTRFDFADNDCLDASSREKLIALKAPSEG